MSGQTLVCPECGVPMGGLDPLGHALTHWPEQITNLPEHKRAILRQHQCVAGGIPAADYRDEVKEAELLKAQ